MKNTILRHFLFWIAYSIQGTLLEYAWIHTYFLPNDQLHSVVLAILFNLALLPAKMAFTYWAVHIFTVQGFKKNANLVAIIFEISAGLFMAIVLHRLVSNYYIADELSKEPPRSFSEVFNVSKMFVGLLDIGYVAGIAVALKLFRMQATNLRKEKDLVKDKLETELKFLKNQINPHFLFNTLNNIYGLARKKSDKAPEAVLKLSKLLRFMLYESGKEAITITDEIRILEDYVELERMRYSNRLQICFDKEIDNEQQLITPLILLPFVENAFKHGLNDISQLSQIKISMVLNHGRLIFNVQNNHDNDDGAEINEKIGLSNVRRQLELMYNDFSLTIDNFAKTFIVNLQINLNSNGTI